MQQRPPIGQQRPVVQQQPPGGKKKPSMKERRLLREQASLREREKRWNSHKLAIPYATEGPKITYGILWFFLIVGSVMSGKIFERPSITSVVVAIVIGPIAGLAALQVGNVWFADRREARSWVALAAYILAVSGFAGFVGVGVGLIGALLICVVGASLGDDSNRPFSQVFNFMFQGAVPVGLVVASFAAIASLELPDDLGAGSLALLSLVLLVSAYEAGDFIVGSGASNAIEGPLAGVITLGVVAMPMALVPGKAFSSDSMVVMLFALLTMICCPLGQMLASAVLPRPTSWAPALRRLDSYLLAAPLWLLLLTQLSF